MSINVFIFQSLTMEDPGTFSFSQIKSVLSDDPETKGFDLSSGNKWLYSENFPLREYQFKIVEAALYSNTLVCLPTGNKPLLSKNLINQL